LLKKRLKRKPTDTSQFKEWFAKKHNIYTKAVSVSINTEIVDLWYGDANGCNIMVTAEDGAEHVWPWDLMTNDEDDDFWKIRKAWVISRNPKDTLLLLKSLKAFK